MKTRVLTKSDLYSVVSQTGIDTFMDLMTDRIGLAFETYDPAITQTPQRSGFNYLDPVGLVEWMPLHEVGKKVTMKIVGYHPANPVKLGLPTIVSTLSAFDTRSGHLQAIVDATFLTSIRTGAASAVASELLANPDSTVLGLVGCGAQSITQAHAILRRFPISEILLYDSEPTAIETFSSRALSFMPEDVSLSKATLQEIGEKSDILCTSTSVDVHNGPVVELNSSKPWLHVNAVGSDFPGKTELPLPFLQASFVCPDFIQQAQVEGECQQLSPDQFSISIVDVAKDKAKFASVKSQTTVFDSTGWALEDWVAMDLLIEKANQFGVGQKIEIECITADPRSPYEFLPQRNLKESSSIRVRSPKH